MTKDELIYSLNYNMEEIVKYKNNIKDKDRYEFLLIEIDEVINKINRVKHNYKKSTLLHLKNASSELLDRCMTIK